MRPVVVTGAGVLSAAGAGVERLREALADGRSLARQIPVSLPRGREGAMGHAPLGPWDPAEHLSPRALRKMVGEAQAVSTAFLMAMAHAGAADRPVDPGRLGTYLGSGFGCMQTTEDFLKDLFTEGMATVSPFLFAESLANSPLGHAAILLDARGPSIGVACGDASAPVAMAQAFRDIRKGRVDRAACGGYELSSAPMREVVARLAARSGGRPVLGEGVAVLVMEDEATARASGAPILARVAGVGEAGDPSARPTGWSHDPEAWAAAHAAALEMAGPRQGAGVAPDKVYLHQPGSGGALRAEATAVDLLGKEAGRPERAAVSPVFGAFAAAGGLAPVAAALDCAAGTGRVLVSAGAWGGATSALVLERPEA